jgi:hypothetical protein
MSDPEQWKYPPLASKIDAFIPLALDPDYRPKIGNPDKINNYISIE